jgi:deazaflavin-dependent oxidoreductase (nitroreductase family)
MDSPTQVDNATPVDNPTDWVASHVRAYVETDGRDGHLYRGWPTLLLTTRGRKSGQLRRTALIYGQDTGRHLLVASNAGAAQHPAWHLNLLEHPDVTVQVGADKFPARARTATAEEKRELWQVMTTIFLLYDTYQAATDRDIPLVIIERALVILVIGATGNVGRHVTSQLLAAGVPVRALTRDPASARLPPGVEVVQGDLLSPVAHDVDAVFLMWPLATATQAPALMETLQGRRIVFLSSAAVQDDLAEQPDPIGDLHAGVEKAIERSALDWTFLRPYGFATNTLAWQSQIRAADTVRGAHGAAAMTLLHEADIASVAVRALTEDGHAGRKYVLTGPEVLTQVDQVHILGEALGRPLRWEEIPPDAARQRMLAWLPADVVDVVLTGYAHLAQTPGPVTSTVEDVTGVPARTFREWVADHAADF